MDKTNGTDVNEQNQNFFKSLFDFSFKNFITLKLVRILYGAGIIIGAIVAIFSIIMAANRGIGGFILTLIAAPVSYFFGIIALRIFLEFIMVLFKIEENTK
ncbi:MAG TPA: DUF4282 domain-containing protein [Candidatus Goldiibacteriota bacterium]|nr:DUF4282 domain-containing protein [Candidatus Goldiibacteriota bacterium]